MDEVEPLGDVHDVLRHPFDGIRCQAWICPDQPAKLVAGPQGNLSVGHRDEVHARASSGKAGIAEEIASGRQAQHELVSIARRTAEGGIAPDHEGERDRLALAENDFLRGSASNASSPCKELMRVWPGSRDHAGEHLGEVVVCWRAWARAHC